LGPSHVAAAQPLHALLLHSLHMLLLLLLHRFFSTLFLRAAKMNRSLGGGSLSALLVVPGRPATGVSKRVDLSKYQTLSEEQKAKMKVRATNRKAGQGLGGK
jgi:hypothetical protein